MSVPPGELTGSATKFRSYPHKFREIIEHAKQLAQCEASLNPFPIKSLFLDKSAMYITEAIAERAEKGVPIPPGRYCVTFNDHLLIMNRVLASVPQRPRRLGKLFSTLVAHNYIFLSSGKLP